MKNSAVLIRSFLLPLALLSAGPASAQLSGTSLNIGTSNLPQTRSAVIGNNNQIGAASAEMNLLSGDSNWINGGTQNFISGQYNGTQVAWTSAIFGSWNSGNVQISSMIVGVANHQTSADTCLTVGFDNQSTGWMQAQIGWGLVSGYQGVTSNNPTMVVGSFNVDKADQRFVVGVGADATHRDNALEVSKTGKVTLLKDVTMTKRQGDLGMGRFGNAGDQ